jgi:transposase-like protein
MAALLAGQGVCEIAREYKIAHPVISSWKSKLGPEKLDEIRAKRGDELDEMIYGYVIANLTALRAQAEAMSDETYLRQQPANELAILHGVMADKVVRLLEAHTAAHDYRRVDPVPQ